MIGSFLCAILAKAFHFITDHRQNMLTDITTLLQDREKWESMRDNTGRLGKCEYRWERIFDNIERALDASGDIHS
ncbi:MAG: hypothetical protein ACMUIM_06140 [bacterium]